MNDAGRICFGVLLLLSLSRIPVFAQQKDKRPNIVYIMSDDHAYQAISAYGYRLNNTPNIDRMAKKAPFYQCLRYQFAVCAEPRGLAYRQTQLYQWQD